MTVTGWNTVSSMGRRDRRVFRL